MCKSAVLPKPSEATWAFFRPNVPCQKLCEFHLWNFIVTILICTCRQSTSLVASATIPRNKKNFSYSTIHIIEILHNLETLNTFFKRSQLANLRITVKQSTPNFETFHDFGREKQKLPILFLCKLGTCLSDQFPQDILGKVNVKLFAFKGGDCLHGLHQNTHLQNERGKFAMNLILLCPDVPCLSNQPVDRIKIAWNWMTKAQLQQNHGLRCFLAKSLEVPSQCRSQTWWRSATAVLPANV